MKDQSIAVVHLVWIPYGIGIFQSFVNSYVQHRTNVEHELVFIFNGVTNESDTAIYHQYAKTAGLRYRSFIFKNGQDIDCYFRTAKQLSSAYVIFLNSYSNILAAGWLENYIHNFSENVGIIGGSGSWQSYYSSVYQKHSWLWQSSKGFLYNYKKYKLFIKAFVYWRFLFKPFPNPHIRTNAFMVRRLEFIDACPGPVETKFKAYQFENGRKSLTNFYLRKRKQVLVVDRYGKLYEPREWISSRTFWIGDQECLIVSDNQTSIYQEANSTEKKSMTKLAWGINE